MALAVKLILTAGVCALLWWSLQVPDQGIMGEIAALGPIGAVAVGMGFLLAVVLYCRDLFRLMQAIAPANRSAAPRSVWLMLLIPYNFVEDFWIVANIALSLRAEAQARPALARGADAFGLAAGLGWCGLQIVSLVPLPVGSLAGVLALPLWLWHWRHMRRARKIILSGR